MDYKEAAEVIEQYSKTTTLLLGLSQSLRTDQKKEHRRLKFLFGKIRQASYLLEQREKILGSLSYIAWTSKEKKKGDIVKGVPWNAFWREDWQIGFVSKALRDVLVAISGTLEELTIEEVKRTLKDQNRRATVEMKLVSSNQDKVRFTVSRDKKLRTGKALIDQIKSQLGSYVDAVYITYNHHYLTLSIPARYIRKYEPLTQNGEASCETPPSDE